MHDFFILLIFLPFIGFFMGILSILYGLGGGVVIIPVIYIFLRYLNYDQSLAVKISIGTSMLNVLFSTAIAGYQHHKDQNILWGVVKHLIPFVVIGSIIGVILVHVFSGQILKYVFIVFLIGILIYSLFNRNFKQAWKLQDYQEPSQTSAGILGLAMGTFSVLVGIGGGTIILPYLRHYRMPMINATAVSTVIAPVLALIGSLGFFTIHLHNTPPYTIGAINLPIFIAVFIGSWLGIQFGRLISPHFSDHWRARTFPILIALMVILMVV